MIALFISLGGVSYGFAAGTIDSREIKNNSVGSTDIRNSTVRGKDTRNGSLTGSDVKNGSLTGSDVKNDGLTGNDVLESSLGTVPSATTANTANFAGLAGATTGLAHASVTASFGGPDKTLFTINGFQVFLHCDLAPRAAMRSWATARPAATEPADLRQVQLPRSSAATAGRETRVARPPRLPGRRAAAHARRVGGVPARSRLRPGLLSAPLLLPRVHPGAELWPCRTQIGLLAPAAPASGCRVALV